MARLLEHDALRILSDYGVSVPDFAVVSSPAEAAALTERFGGKSVLKALIPTSGRGGAGAVRIARSATEAETIAASLLGEEILDFHVDRLLVSRVVDAEWEIFVSFQPGTDGMPMLTASALGGIDVAEVRVRDPDALVQRPLEGEAGLSDSLAREVGEDLGLGELETDALVPALQGMYRAFVGLDAALLEVNPLMVTVEPSVIAATAVLVLN